MRKKLLSSYFASRVKPVSRHWSKCSLISGKQRIEHSMLIEFNKMYDLKLINQRWVGTRLDKYIMQKYGVPWSAAHKLIRSKRIYVLKPDGTQVAKDI